ncbi:MAG: TIGR04219 family outer membrane beta-barrel protein [Pseudomonadota bacterium]
MVRRKSQFAVLGAALAVASMAETAQADMLFGVYAGAGSWQQETSGELQSSGSLVDVQEDLGVEDERNRVGYVAVEHPLPVIPNVRLQYSGINANGNEVLSRSIEVNGTTFSFADTVTSVVDLVQGDAVLYYELTDTLVSFDVGLAARWVDGEIDLQSATQSARAEFSGVLPLLYTAARIDLPFSGFWLGGQALGVSYDGDSLIDLNAQIGWESALGLGAELGWRSFELTLENYDELDRADIEVSGPYLALNYHF